MKGGFCKTCQQEVDVPMMKHKHDEHPEEYAQIQAKSAATRAAKAAAKKKRKRTIEQKKRVAGVEMQGDVRVLVEETHDDLDDPDDDQQSVDLEGSPPGTSRRSQDRPPGKAQTVPVGSTAIPKTGVVVLKLGPHELPLEYGHLFKTHLLYLDMQKEHKLTDTFSEVIEQCVGYCFDLMGDPIELEDNDGPSNGHTEEEVQRSNYEPVAI